MLVDPKKLIKKFNGHATKALEAAVVEAHGLGVPEVGPALFLYALLDSEASAISQLFEAVGVDRGALRQQLFEAVAPTAVSPGRRPIFTAGLFQWFQDTWVHASVDQNAPRIDTAHLGWMWLTRRARYDALEPAATQDIDPEPWRAKLDRFTDPGQAPPPADPLFERLRRIEARLAALDESSSGRVAQLEQRLAVLEDLASDAL